MMGGGEGEKDLRGGRSRWSATRSGRFRAAWVFRYAARLLQALTPPLSGLPDSLAAHATVLDRISTSFLHPEPASELGRPQPPLPPHRSLPFQNPD